MKIIASQRFGKSRGYRGGRFTGAQVELSIVRGHLKATVIFKSSPEPFNDDQRDEALMIYQEIEEWAENLRRLSDLRAIEFPPVSMNGKWPPIEGLTRIMRGIGLEIIHRE